MVVHKLHLVRLERHDGGTELAHHHTILLLLVLINHVDKIDVICLRSWSILDYISLHKIDVEHRLRVVGPACDLPIAQHIRFWSGARGC